MISGLYECVITEAEPPGAHSQAPAWEREGQSILTFAPLLARVSLAVFPEFSLSGYFWEDERQCRKYMHRAVTDNHADWIESTLRPMLDENLKAIIFNNLRKGPKKNYLNSTCVVTQAHDFLDEEHMYNKVFLPTLEKVYTDTGRDDRLVLDAPWGRFGFTTCYDLLFPQLLLEYARIDQVDAIVELASWRAVARRDYPRMNVGTSTYYGDLWNTMLSALSAHTRSGS